MTQPNGNAPLRGSKPTTWAAMEEEKQHKQETEKAEPSPTGSLSEEREEKERETQEEASRELSHRVVAPEDQGAVGPWQRDKLTGLTKHRISVGTGNGGTSLLLTGLLLFGFGVYLIFEGGSELVGFAWGMTFLGGLILVVLLALTLRRLQPHHGK